MKIKITDEKLDELAFEQSSHFTAYKKGFRAAEQMHQAKFDTAMQIIEMQREALKFYEAHENWFSNVKNKAGNCFSEIHRIDLCFYDEGKMSIGGKKAVNTLKETDKMMKELKECICGEINARNCQVHQGNGNE